MAPLCPTKDTDLVVIGAGLMRTGTASLQIALQRLLGGKCYHMKEVFQNTNHVYTWIKAVDHGLTDAEWRDLLSKYRATVDLPAALFYEEIARLYPNAKIILSKRDPKSWQKSCCNTVLNKPLFVIPFPMNIFIRLSPLHRFTEMTHKLITKQFGSDFDIHNEESSTRHFNEWNDAVIKKVPSDKLLVFEASMGWEPLCSFLGVPVPDEPYPHVNSTEEFQTFLHTRNRVFNIVGWSLATSIVAGISFVAYKLIKK